MGSLEGKVAIVTGGAQGIGRAIAGGLAAEGARIVIADLNGADDAAAGFAGGLGLTVDVADEADVARMVDATVDACGGIDILVNNAGLYASLAMRPFDEIPLDEWRRVMDVNVASMFLTCRGVVPVLRERGGGRIVNISSGTPFRGVPFLLHYVTSKGAIVAFTRALAKELGSAGVLVNCVAPGFTMSDGVKDHPEVIEKLRDVSVSARVIQRDQVPEDVVGAVIFLCSPGASFVTGQTIVIDGGQYFHLMRLSLYEFEQGVETVGGERVVYDLATGTAHYGAASVDGPALVWQLEGADDGALLSADVHLDPFADWVVRCDRIDFPKGGIAYRHTHPGPGIRYLLHGDLEIETEGRSTFYGPGGAWFESGPEPVLATASQHLETAFVRVLVLPAEWAGKRTIRHVDPADDDRPRLQRATVHLEHPLRSPLGG